MCLEGGRVLEVVSHGRGQITYLGEGSVCLGTKGRKLYRLAIKWTLSKTVSKDFSKTLRVFSIDCFQSIASHKKCIFLNMPAKLFLKNNLLMQENHWKIVAACTLSKTAALPQLFFWHILRTVPKEFGSFSKLF